MPYFTVVIPTFNRAEKLTKAIRSVLDQTYSDFELLVMDDGSTDHTEEVVKNFSDNRIRYEWAPNSGGPATPRNRGIEASKAPWISFLDADDIWYPKRLEYVAEAIKNNNHLDVICHNEILHLLNSGQKTVLKYGPFEPEFYRIMLLGGNRLSTSAVTIRRKFLFNHKLRFNQANNYVIVEDYDLWLHLAKHEAIFFFLETPLGEYIIENDNISHLTTRSRHNQRVLLQDHVFKIQEFEPNKKKLWQEIHIRLDLEEARELLMSKFFYKSCQIILKSVVSAPLTSLRFVFLKLLHILKVKMKKV